MHRQMGLDFTGYKTPMLYRRVRRRQGLSHVGDLAAYLQLLEQSTAEVQALASDFLISVTEFFREPHAWEVLAQDAVPIVLERRRPGDAVRVWVPACATGEEAYSLAMVFLEHPALVERRLKLQVFATDIDKQALAAARRGHYRKSIEHTVSPQRLQRFFEESPHGYQVSKALREVVTFAPQNVITDPPFSRMDIVSCRNLLIYMQPPLQRRVLEMFHFSLRPGGLLVLGKSESVSVQDALFDVASQRARIFRRIEPAPPMEGAKPVQLSLVRSNAAPTPTLKDLHPDYAQAVHEALTQIHAASAVLTNRDGAALYFYGAVHDFLRPRRGAPTSDLRDLVDEAIWPRLQPSMRQALSERRPVAATVDDDGIKTPLRFTVSPVPHTSADDLLLVSFEHLPRPSDTMPLRAGNESSRFRSIEVELRDTKRELRAVIEELGSTNEELKVAHEEAMSTNEELQSTNEELETSKEELQSVNEELTSVNQQLQVKIEELETVNDDLANLLASTNIPTLFLDRELKVKRFTPAATRVFNLIASDVNRPLSDITSHTDLKSLIADAQSVLADLVPIERETVSNRGEHLLRGTMPFRTQDNRIDGVLITFTDVTRLKSATEGLRRFAAVLQGSNDAIVVHGLDGRIQIWNHGAEALYGHREADVLGRDIATLLPHDSRANYAREVERTLAGEVTRGLDGQRRHRDGTTVDVSTSLSLIRNEAGHAEAVASIERDVTRHKAAERHLRESELRFRTLADSAPVLIWMSDREGRLEFANQSFSNFLGIPVEQLLGRRLGDFLLRDDGSRLADGLSALSRARDRFEGNVRLHPRSGPARWMKTVAMLRPDAPDGTHCVIGSMIDVDAQVSAEEALREAARHKDEFLAMLGHELRNPLAPIRNAAEILHRIAGDNKQLAWVHDLLVRQVGHMTRLVDDLLDISRITRGTMQLRLEPVDLRFAVGRAIDAAQPLIERNRHRFVSTTPEQPTWIEGDSIRLIQVFENLLTNAAKYTNPGGDISIALEATDQGAVVRVRDTGLGIAPDIRSRIFDLFVQDQRSVDRSQGGLGIGLALVKHLVELQGGSVEAHSDGVDKGSEFVVRFRVLSSAAAPAPDQGSPCVADTGSGRVMIVEDDVEAAESLAVLLRLLGYAVERAVDLDSALALCREFRPQAVLLDLALPGADGYEVARRLRALPHTEPGVTFIAVSGYGQPDDFRRSEEAGFVRHLVKPVDPMELHKLLAQTLHGKTP
jgi:two-component system, chemotaxis family, CheB/CheR fusion protein